MKRPFTESAPRRATAVKAIAALVLCAVVLVAAGCSSGPTSAQQQTAALAQVDKVTNDVNSLAQAQEWYNQSVAPPCPANLTPGTFPGYTCGGNPATPATQLAQMKQQITKATTRLAVDSQRCITLVHALPNGEARGLHVSDSLCRPALPPG